MCSLLVLTFVVTLVLTRAEWQLVWSDEFDGDEIDYIKWTHEITQWGGGNNEFQVYTDDPLNSYVQNGKLFIKPTLFEEITNPKTGAPYGSEFRENDNTLDLTDYYGRCDTAWDHTGCVRTGKDIPPTASARLKTAGKFAFRFGRVEISAKMSAGDWLWPALWLLPESWCYGDWPRSGEIDICEIFGNEDLRWNDAQGPFAGLQHMASTMHWGMRWDDSRYLLTQRGTINESSDFARNFHTYVFEWTTNGLSFIVDDYRVLDVPYPLINQSSWWNGYFEWGKPWSTIDENDPTQNPWNDNNYPLLVPFDTKFHFILNVAVGGTSAFSDYAINRGGIQAFVKPWSQTQNRYDAMNDFYDARCAWKWTWDKERDNNAMQVDYIRVYKDAALHPAEQADDCLN